MNCMLCQVGEFQPNNKSFIVYLERVSLFHEVNEVA